MPIQAPEHLSTATKHFIDEVTASFSLLPQQTQLLLSAGEALDRAEQARARVERDGPFVEDRFGQLRAHPALAVERDARAAFSRTVKALRLPLFADRRPGST